MRERVHGPRSPRPSLPPFCSLPRTASDPRRTMATSRWVALHLATRHTPYVPWPRRATGVWPAIEGRASMACANSAAADLVGVVVAMVRECGERGSRWRKEEGRVGAAARRARPTPRARVGRRALRSVRPPPPSDPPSSAPHSPCAPPAAATATPPATLAPRRRPPSWRPPSTRPAASWPTSVSVESEEHQRGRRPREKEREGESLADALSPQPPLSSSPQTASWPPSPPASRPCTPRNPS